VIFGASGDLTHRKLIPALYNLAADGALPPAISVVGFARRDKTDEIFRAELEEATRKFSRQSLNDELWKSFASSVSYHRSAFDNFEGYQDLARKLDELDAANLVARHIKTKPPIVEDFRPADAVKSYPDLIRAAEAPVIDTSCAALLQLARRVQQSGQKVVLTGEGADEWLIGYPWYKSNKILEGLNLLPGLRLGELARRSFLRLNNMPQYSRQFRRDVEDSIGGPNAWVDAYGLLSTTKLRFYSDSMHAVRMQSNPWADLQMPLHRAKHWHPLNRGVWIAGRVTLAGHLLQAKGDRVAMHSSVEVRYPFLDEKVFDFLAHLHPKWKLRGFHDKYLLRLLAKRWLPPSVYQRRKVIFRAPLDSFHLDPEPPYIGQLLSPESLARTGYFDSTAVQHWRKAFRQMRPGSLPRLSAESGLAAVVATQLWHHLYIDPHLADLP